MYVTEDMVLGFDSGLDGSEQFDTACPHSSAAEITMTNGRSVGDEYISVIRYTIPLLKTLVTSGQIECPVAKLRLPEVQVQC